LCFVRRGGYTELFDRYRRSCGPSTLALHPAGERHAESFGESICRSFNIELTSHWHLQFPEYAPQLRTGADVTGGPLVLVARRLFQEARRTDSASALAIEGLVLELLAGFVRRSDTDRSPHWLARARELLHDRFQESLDLPAIAREVGVHPAHLAAAFRRRFRVTIGDYQRQLRVEYACRQLAVGRVSLAEIAAGAGFADQSHFTRVFKRYFGLTPGAYRRQLTDAGRA
jgi:AraC family transcriptional regulator